MEEGIPLCHLPQVQLPCLPNFLNMLRRVDLHVTALVWSIAARCFLTEQDANIRYMARREV